MDKQQTQHIVRDAYGKAARGEHGCGCGTCGPAPAAIAEAVGYSTDELRVIPHDANLGLSCGNPTALAGLKAGETVLDLGAGAGFDCFLAATKVGPSGMVIGVDMTPAMVDKARAIADKNGVQNVDFRLGEIERLPVPDHSMDVVISNCVINLSVDKPRVFREICRVLKPGGRVAISDIALLRELPPAVRESVAAYVGCVSGAVLIDQYRQMVEASGLQDVHITVKGASDCTTPETLDPIGRALQARVPDPQALAAAIVSVYVEGHKEG